MKLFKWTSILVVVAMLFAAFAPAMNVKAAASGDVVSVLSSDKRFTTLVAAVNAAGLTSTLQGAGPFTVFAPTNSAFNALGKKTINALLANPSELAKILTYHVVAGKEMAADVVSATSFTTVNGAPIVVRMSGGSVFINNARITQTNIEATNGVIHVLNAVIVPPSKDIVDTLSSLPQFSTLVAAVGAANLGSTLKGTGPFTVLAPTNAAFAKLGKAAIAELLANPTDLAEILTYHVLSGAAYSGDVKKLTHAATVNGAPIAIEKRANQLFINNVLVTRTDILATNGVIHVLNAVILPPSKDIVDTLAGDKKFSTLVAAVNAAGLTSTLKGSGPFTVFAPTNAAFNKLGQKTINALLADPTALSKILTYHVVSGQVYSGDVVKLTSATTVEGQDVTITLKKSGVYINNSRVIITNILTTNGVIHVIDTVLLPPA